MKINTETVVDRETFELVVSTEAKVLGKTYKHTERTDLTALYELFLNTMIDEGYIHAN